MLVHFPIALITVGFVFDLLAMIRKNDPFLSKTGYWLEILGMAGAVFAFGTGYFFTSPMEGEAVVMREKHELYATISLISIIVSTLFRMVCNYLDKTTAGIRYVQLALFFISLVFISFTGFLGGNLVMDYMIGL